MKRIAPTNAFLRDERDTLARIEKAFARPAVARALGRQQVHAYLDWLRKHDAAAQAAIRPCLDWLPSRDALLDSCGPSVEALFALVSRLDQAVGAIERWQAQVAAGRAPARAAADTALLVVPRGIDEMRLHLEDTLETARSLVVELQSAPSDAAVGEGAAQAVGARAVRALSLCWRSIFKAVIAPPSPTLSTEHDMPAPAPSQTWRASGEDIVHALELDESGQRRLAWVRSLRVMCRAHGGEEFTYTFKPEAHDGVDPSGARSAALVVEVWSTVGNERLGECRLDPDNLSVRRIGRVAAKPDEVRIVLQVAAAGPVGGAEP